MLKKERIRLEEEKVNIEREIINTVNRLRSSLRRLQLLEKDLQIAKKSYDISQARFTDGDISSQTLALDRERLNRVYLSHLEAFISYKLLAADLMRKTFYDFENNRSTLE
jgi:outer membrane protein TolC